MSPALSPKSEQFLRSYPAPERIKLRSLLTSIAREANSLTDTEAKNFD